MSDLTPDEQRIADALDAGGVVALTGAGMSTDSGIPDYRSPASAARVRTPIQGPEFARSAAVRQRYWARAIVGWERFRHAAPCEAHRALAAFEAEGSVSGIITQNVDRLHHAAGSRRILELHGALAEVKCLSCGNTVDRDSMQARLRAANPSWLDESAPLAPDGDADLDDRNIEEFNVPACENCGGALKPSVVFFGDNVARAIVDEAFAWVDSARSLLVLGTSLTVFSGYRFLRRAAERRIPIYVVNRGPVRGEEQITLRIDAGLSETLSRLTPHLASSERRRERPSRCPDFR